MDNHSYGHAREALQNALVLRPKDSRATRLLKEIEGEEHEYVRLRREKTDLYQAAVNAWKNGEVSQALSQMKHVLDLDQKAPDTSSPDAAGMYQSFYNKLRSEHDAISAAYADARRQLADSDFGEGPADLPGVPRQVPGAGGVPGAQIRHRRAAAPAAVGIHRGRRSPRSKPSPISTPRCTCVRDALRATTPTKSTSCDWPSSSRTSAIW